MNLRENLDPRELIGPLLDDWLNGGNSQSLERTFLRNHFGVCPYVCLYACMSMIKLQVTDFDPTTYVFFLNMFLRTMGQNCFFPFFESFSSLSLYWPQVTPSDLQTQFLACRAIVTWKEQTQTFFEYFIF